MAHFLFLLTSQTEGEATKLADVMDIEDGGLTDVTVLPEAVGDVLEGSSYRATGKSSQGFLLLLHSCFEGGKDTADDVMYGLDVQTVVGEEGLGGLAFGLAEIRAVTVANVIQLHPFLFRHQASNSHLSLATFLQRIDRLHCHPERYS